MTLLGQLADEWKKAMDEEVQCLSDKTFTITALPKGMKTAGR